MINLIVTSKYDIGFVMIRAEKMEYCFNSIILKMRDSVVTVIDTRDYKFKFKYIDGDSGIKVYQLIRVTDIFTPYRGTDRHGV